MTLKPTKTFVNIYGLRKMIRVTYERERKKEILKNLFMTSLNNLKRAIRLHFVSTDLETKD